MHTENPENIGQNSGGEFEGLEKTCTFSSYDIANKNWESWNYQIFQKIDNVFSLKFVFYRNSNYFIRKAKLKSADRQNRFSGSKVITAGQLSQRKRSKTQCMKGNCIKTGNNFTMLQTDKLMVYRHQKHQAQIYDRARLTSFGDSIFIHGRAYRWHEPPQWGVRDPTMFKNVFFVHMVDEVFLSDCVNLLSLVNYPIIIKGELKVTAILSTIFIGCII